MQDLRFRNGDTLPALGLGTWKSAPGEVGAAVETAIRIGYRHIDCAAIYGNEAEVGAAIAGCIADGVVTRDDLWITSKLWNNRHRAKDVPRGIDKTLGDLGLEALDLYLIHWPVALGPKVGRPEKPEDFLPLEKVPLMETWEAMEKLVDAGKARHIGVSNYSLPKLEAHLEARIVPEMNQVELHPYLQQSELVAFGQSHGIHMTGYSPLGSADRPDGMKAADEPVLLADPEIARIANEVGATPAQVLLAWGLQRGTSVIPKSVNKDRMAQNLAAAEIELPASAMTAIAAIDRHRRYITGKFWEMPGGPYTVADLWDEA